MAQNINVDSRGTVVSAVVLGTLGVLSFIVQPALVQGYVTHLGVTEPQAVNLAGLEMLGVAISTIILAVFSVRVNWRIALVFGLGLAVIGNLASAALAGSEALWIARLIAGFGHGAIISLSFTFVGLTARVDRNVAWYLVALLSYGAIGLWLMPSLLDHIGISGLFLTFACLSAMGVATLRYVPRSSADRKQPSKTARQLTPTFLTVGLAGVLAYNMAQGIAWAILFLVGTGAGLPEGQVAQALFLSQLFAIAGALASVFLAEHLGRQGPIAVGTIAGAACIALLLGRPSSTLFVIAVCGFNLLWNFVLPFILGAVGDFDEHGRMMGPAIAAQMIGLGAGPLLAGQLLEGGTYRLVELVCIGFFIVSYILLTIPLARHRQLTLGATAP